jgi:Protein of unknown function (DUF3822)
LKLSINIQPVIADTTNADLYIEMNEQGLSYLILENSTFLALVKYEFDPGSGDDTVAGYIHQVIKDQPILLQKFKAVHVIYGYAQAILVPQQMMKDMDNNGMIQLFYGDSGERVVRTDFIYRSAIQNVYSIPAVVEMVITRYFGFALFTHIYSLLPNVVLNPVNLLYCIFSTGQMKVLFIREGKLQLMQNFQYSTPEDVAYHLLNLCKSFDANTSGISVRLSGMIDESSALFTELNKYFLLLEFDTLPEKFQYPEAINQYPSHYFSHLFSIAAACA